MDVSQIPFWEKLKIQYFAAYEASLTEKLNETDREKFLVVFYEDSEDPNDFNTHLVNMYVNPLIINENHPVDIIAAEKLHKFSQADIESPLFCRHALEKSDGDLDIIRKTIDKSKDWIKIDSDVHFIFGSSFYFPPDFLQDSPFVNQIDLQFNMSTFHNIFEKLIVETVLKLRSDQFNISCTLLQGRHDGFATEDDQKAFYYYGEAPARTEEMTLLSDRVQNDIDLFIDCIRSSLITELFKSRSEMSVNESKHFPMLPQSTKRALKEKYQTILDALKDQSALSNISTLSDILYDADGQFRRWSGDLEYYNIDCHRVTFSYHPGLMAKLVYCQTMIKQTGMSSQSVYMKFRYLPVTVKQSDTASF